MALFSVVGAAAIAAQAADNHQKRDADEEPWRPPFVGGVRGPVLGVGYNGFLEIDGATYGNDSSGEFEDDVVVRRARLTFGRNIGGQWAVKGSAEINPNDIEIKDLFGFYKGLSYGSIRIGSQKEPFSLQQMTSARFTTLMERGLIVESLSPGRNIGVTISSRRGNMNGAIGVFAGGFQQDGIATTGIGATGRLTRHLFIDDRHIWHAGVSTSYRTLGTTAPQFRSRPESGVTDNYMIDTGEIDNAEDVFRLGLEAAYVRGALSLQGEYIVSSVGRDSGLSRLNFGGWYILGSWFLTGESRSYLVGTGTFGRVFPSSPVTLHGGRGAWELALRFSQADLTDDDIVGGQETNASLGMNWYLGEYVVVMANYIKVLDIDRPGSVFDGNDMNIFQMRLQLEF